MNKKPAYFGEFMPTFSSKDAGFLSCTENGVFCAINPFVSSYNPYILENNASFFLLIQKTSLSLQ